ncbi:MAG: hypothetical protein WD341_19890, partial [Tistlia sp.]
AFGAGDRARRAGPFGGTGVHVDDAVIGADGRLDIPAIQPIARMGYYDYTVVREVFEMRIPEAAAEALAGLEGRA